MMVQITAASLVAESRTWRCRRASDRFRPTPTRKISCRWGWRPHGKRSAFCSTRSGWWRRAAVRGAGARVSEAAGPRQGSGRPLSPASGARSGRHAARRPIVRRLPIWSGWPGRWRQASSIRARPDSPRSRGCTPLPPTSHATYVSLNPALIRVASSPNPPERMNLEKLKDSARKFEQKEDWRKAIDVYLKAIQQIESGAESSPDLSLYNRVGDLYLKINDTPAAVRSYERAVDLYADQGFFNNAIALCGKILRVNPGPHPDLSQAGPASRAQERGHRGQAESDRVSRADECARPARPGVPVGQGVRRPVFGEPGNPPHAGRAAPRLISRGRGPGAASQACRRHRGPRRYRLARPVPERPTETESHERPEVEPPPRVSGAETWSSSTPASIRRRAARRLADLQIPPHPDLGSAAGRMRRRSSSPVPLDGLEPTSEVDFSDARERT